MILFDNGLGLFDDAVGDFDDGGVVNATVTLSGIALSATTGLVIALGTNSVMVSVEGVTANVTTGTVTAVGTIVKRGRKRSAQFLPFTARPVTVQVDGRAKVATQTLESGIAPITATGIHNARANVRGLRLKTVCRIPSADGIINPTDEEMKWLLQALEPRQIANISNVSMRHGNL
jgi:hypothetical protein